MVVGCIALSYVIAYPFTADLNQYTIDDSNLITWNIDQIRRNKGQFIISGWAVERGKNIATEDLDVLLYDADENRYSRLYTFAQERKDVTDSFSDDECNYDYSGFEARVCAGFLAAQKTYRIVLAYQNNGSHYLVFTDTQIERGGQ